MVGTYYRDSLDQGISESSRTKHLVGTSSTITQDFRMSGFSNSIKKH